MKLLLITVALLLACLMSGMAQGFESPFAQKISITERDHLLQSSLTVGAHEYTTSESTAPDYLGHVAKIKPTANSVTIQRGREVRAVAVIPQRPQRPPLQGFVTKLKSKHNDRVAKMRLHRMRNSRQA